MLTGYGAADWAGLAVTLGWRLPATGAALAAGRIDLGRAEVIAAATSVLDEDAARAVEAKILPGAGTMTRAYVQERARRAVIAADPEGAERRREAAERQAKVSLYGDEDQTATLAGSRLPAVHAAAAMARITAIARAMQAAAGVRGGLDRYRAQVMLALLLGTLPPIPPAQGAPPDPGQPPPGDDGDPGLGPAGPGARGPADQDGPGGSGSRHPAPASPAPASAAPALVLLDFGRVAVLLTPAVAALVAPALVPPTPPVAVLAAAPATTAARAAARTAAPVFTTAGQMTCPHPATRMPRPMTVSVTAARATTRARGGIRRRRTTTRTGPVPPRRGRSWASSRPRWAAWPGAAPAGPGAERGARPGGDGRPGWDGRPVPGLLDVLLPWATLAGLAERPGTLGRIGPVTAAQARQLAAAAQGDPAAQWRVIVTNPAGQALAVTRIPRPGRGRDHPGGARDPARPATARPRAATARRRGPGWSAGSP